MNTPLATLSEIYNFRAVDGRLGTTGQPTQGQFRLIREAGFDTVINLALPTSDNALRDEGAVVSGLGMSYVHIPVDFKAPASQNFRTFCQVMKAFDDRPVFVHCAANMRVSAFVFLYRVLCQRVVLHEAERDLHAIWQPDDVWSQFIQEQLKSHGGTVPLMRPYIRQATPREVENVSGILREAARWLEQSGMAMWRDDELSPARIAADVDAGLFFIAECDGVTAGVVKFQLEDPLFWPDVPQNQSAFVHRLAVVRRFAGGGISSALLGWAVERARSLGRDYLRLDCEASRPRLRAVYERFGFQHHSDRQVGPYFVSRYEYEVTKSPN